MAPLLQPLVPSIGRRMGRAVWWWAVLWGVVLGCAAWLAVRHEMKELFDDTLRMAATEMLAPVLTRTLEAQAQRPLPQRAPGAAASGPVATASPLAIDQTMMWQLVHHGEEPLVLQSSSAAPAEAIFSFPTAGFTDTAQWRVFGLALAAQGHWLYVAHAQGERVETGLELALAVGLATLPMALLALVWLRLRLRQELQPLQRLALRLSSLDALPGGLVLGPPERSELGPVHLALETLTARLELRLARERAFTAHAAHALRTPLAGIDAQLAVALREAAPAQQPRLQRARDAAGRLQRVVAALLALFRSGHEPQRQPLDLVTLLARTPLPGLQLEVRQDHALQADADLVHAALLNLLDNSSRHGAHRAWVSTAQPQVLRVVDDGPGVDAQRRAQLQQALDAGGTEQPAGLGLLLADLVARSHGGRLRLLPGAPGFVVELHLQAAGGGLSPGDDSPPASSPASAPAFLPAFVPASLPASPPESPPSSANPRTP